MLGEHDNALLDADEVTPQLGSRRLFSQLNAKVYLAHSAISPCSDPVLGRAGEVLASYAGGGVEAFPIWLEQRDRLKEKLAQLIDAAGPADLGLLPNTSTGVIAIAQGLSWKPKQRVLVFEGEFPTNVTPWQQAARDFDLELRLLPLAPWHESVDHGLTQLETELKRGARLVAVSSVQFQTGLAMPLVQVGELCQQYGAELFVDGIQGCGVVPLSVREAHIDYLSCGSHKWLMGPEGAAFLYVNPERVSSLTPRHVAWLSHEEPVKFLFEGPGELRYDRPLRKQADVFEVGAPNTVGFAGLEVALDLLLELGISTIFEHVSAYLDALEAELLQRGFESLRRPWGRSGILSVRRPGLGLPALVAALSERGVIVTHPDGVLRFAPHWPNSRDELVIVLEALDQVLEQST